MKLLPGQFYGQTLAAREIAGFKLMESVYHPGTKLPKHSHTHGCFSVMFEGALTENYGKRNLEWTPLCVGFNPPDEEHSNVIHNTGARFFIVEISPKWLERAREVSAKLNDSVVFRGGLLAYLGLQLYHEAQRCDEISPLAVEGLVLNMLAESARYCANMPDGAPPRWLEQARELIRARFAESLAVNNIAQDVGVHPVHLSCMFRKYYHCTVGEYVRQLRVAYACREVSQTEIPLAQIASAVGFYDQSHFTRVFKRRMGMTPAHYRINSRSLKPIQK